MEIKRVFVWILFLGGLFSASVQIRPKENNQWTPNQATGDWVSGDYDTGSANSGSATAYEDPSRVRASIMGAEGIERTSTMRRSLVSGFAGRGLGWKEENSSVQNAPIASMRDGMVMSGFKGSRVSSMGGGKSSYYASKGKSSGFAMRS